MQGVGLVVGRERFAAAPRFAQQVGQVKPAERIFGGASCCIPVGGFCAPGITCATQRCAQVYVKFGYAGVLLNEYLE